MIERNLTLIEADLTLIERDLTLIERDLTMVERDLTAIEASLMLKKCGMTAGNLDNLMFIKYNFRTQSRFRVEVAGLQTVCRLNFEDAGNEIPPFSVLRTRHLLIQRNR